MSDKYVTQNCGFLNLLEYGDRVLADRSFNISEDLALFGATLAIPKREVAAKQARSQMLSTVSKGLDLCRESHWTDEKQIYYTRKMLNHPGASLSE